MTELEADTSLGPKTTRDFLVEIHRDMKDVKAEVNKTNGRVTILERFMWTVVGGTTTLIAAAGVLRMLNVV